jgi:uncharacterized protein YndB with AHSA1/START domain
MKTKSATLAPLVRTVMISLNPEAAFARFTEGIASWWPMATHSVGEKETESVILEGRIGGRFYERQLGGKTSDWGTVTAWDPPRLVAFTWHPGRGPDTAQNVEVRFRAASGGTEVEVIHRDWEILGDKAAEMRGAYDQGWIGVLELFAKLS